MVIRFGELNWSSSPFWVPGQKKWRAHGPQDSRLSQLWYSPFPRKPPMSHGQNTVFSNRLLLTISGQSPRQPGMVINPLVGNLYIHSEDFPIWDTHISCFAAHVVSTFPIMAGTQSDVATLIKIIQHDGLIRSPMGEPHVAAEAVDLKVLVRSFNCESHACYVGNPREGFFFEFAKYFFIRKSFAEVGYYESLSLYTLPSDNLT